MPRPRTSAKKAELTGAASVNPERFRDRSEPISSGKPVGEPPSYLSENAQVAWVCFVDELGWLEYDDRGALEAASIVRGQLRDFVEGGKMVPASMLAAMNTSIGKLGASPTDRSKVFQRPSEDGEEDPFDQFMGVN